MFADSVESRRYPRHKLTNAFIVNQKGVCRIFDLSTGGISFGCTSKRVIPETITIDIVDNHGLHLYDLSIKSVWKAENKDMNTSSIYDVIIGAEFHNQLSSEQQMAIKGIIDSVPKGCLSTE